MLYIKTLENSAQSHVQTVCVQCLTLVHVLRTARSRPASKTHSQSVY